MVTERLQSHCDFSRVVDHAGDCTTLEDLCVRYSSTRMLRGLPNVREADFDLADLFARWVRAHLSQRLTASCIAVSLGCLPVRLATVVRARLHHTVRAHIRQQRLETALVLIRAGDKIESVIIGVGYRNRTSFFRDFRERFGMLPSEAKESREPSARCA